MVGTDATLGAFSHTVIVPKSPSDPPPAIDVAETWEVTGGTGR
jgi:hypothetical protein